MRIVKIEAFADGSHANQDGGVSVCPAGWAEIPSTLEIPESFPYVDIVVEDGVVVQMTARDVPEPPEAVLTPSIEDQITDQQEIAVDHEYRITLLELGVTSDAV